jgi:predicted phosphohydrolase
MKNIEDLNDYLAIAINKNITIFGIYTKKFKEEIKKDIKKLLSKDEIQYFIIRIKLENDKRVIGYEIYQG